MATKAAIEAAKKRFIANNYQDTRKFIEYTDKFSSLEFSTQFAKDVFVLATAFLSKSQPVNERLLIALIEISESFDALAKEAAKAERAWRKTIPGADIPGDRQKSRRKRRGGYLKGKKR